MILAEFELAGGAHHAVRFDAANRRDFQHHPVRRHDRARWTEHADHACAGVGRAADDLQRSVTGVDGQDLQLIGLRMWCRSQHACDLERGELGAGVFDALDFQADAGQRLDNGVERGVGVDMLLEPAERGLHAPTPWLSVGTSSAEKP